MFSDEKALQTTQILKESKENFESFAASIRTKSLDPRDNDIPDIFDTAADIIGTIIVSVSGFDATSNSLQMVADMDSEFMAIEKKFLKTMETQMNKLTQKVESTQNEVERRDKYYNSQINELPILFDEVFRKIEEKNKKIIKNEQEKIAQKISIAKEKEKMLTNDLDLELTHELETYEKEWQSRIKEIEEENENLSKHLKSEINKKQHFVNMRGVDLKVKEFELNDKEK